MTMMWVCSFGEAIRSKDTCNVWQRELIVVSFLQPPPTSLSSKRPRTADDFLLFCKFILDYENYEMLRHEVGRIVVLKSWISSNFCYLVRSCDPKWIAQLEAQAQRVPSRRRLLRTVGKNGKFLHPIVILPVCTQAHTHSQLLVMFLIIRWRWLQYCHMLLW